MGGSIGERIGDRVADTGGLRQEFVESISAADIELVEDKRIRNSEMVGDTVSEAEIGTRLGTLCFTAHCDLVEGYNIIGRARVEAADEVFLVEDRVTFRVYQPAR